ncbi:hypothetical protein VTI74DRAFT_389 [Chaetomium olivicolor]
MPIEDQYRLWCSGGGVSDGGPSDWYITDQDQRRSITVQMDGEQETEDLAMKHLRTHIEDLASDVTFIHVAPDGELLSVSNDPFHDVTCTVYYPPPGLIDPPSRGAVQTVVRSELRELDRLGPHIDLVSYQINGETTKTRKVVFKYYWQFQFLGKQWDELNLWLRLPPHPNIVPFDRVVLDEVEGNVVGFTTQYIPGGTLHANPSRTLKLKWCEQLMQVIDDLNLRYGIAHQDVASHNLLVDEVTDNLMLFDFNWSAQIGRDRGCDFFRHRPGRDDVKSVAFTIYELITRDFRFRQKNWEKFGVSEVLDITDWVPHPDVMLDHPVSEFRGALNAWLKKREAGEKVTIYTDAPEYIDWPVLEKRRPEFDGYVHRARAEGREVVEWARPKWSSLKGDFYLLSTGKMLSRD